MKQLLSRSFNYSIIALTGQSLYFGASALSGNPFSPVWNAAYNWFPVWGAAVLSAIAAAAAVSMFKAYQQAVADRRAEAELDGNLATN